MKYGCADDVPGPCILPEGRLAGGSACVHAGVTDTEDGRKAQIPPCCRRKVSRSRQPGFLAYRKMWCRLHKAGAG